MKKIYLSICFLLLFGSLIYVQAEYDKNQKKVPNPEPFVPTAAVIKAADLGLHTAAADIAWLAAIQYFGGGQSRTFEKLDDYLFLAADLDEKFAYPYAFGVLVLPGVKSTDEGIEIAKLGIERNIPDYRIPYYLATTYHVEKEDKKNAALYFDLAAKTPGAPAGIKKVAANYGARPDLRSQTRDIWQGIYDTTKDDLVKEKALNYIDHFDILTALENIAKAYKDRVGNYPADVDELVNKGILKEAPNDPFGFQYKFNQENGRAEIK